MFGRQLSDQIQIGLDLANVIIFFLTLCALFLTLLQLRRDIKLSREATVRESARNRESAQREREMDREIEYKEKYVSREQFARELY
jgi:predicted Holliday junction resolvase-like endonuclease